PPLRERRRASARSRVRASRTRFVLVSGTSKSIRRRRARCRSVHDGRGPRGARGRARRGASGLAARWGRSERALARDQATRKRLSIEPKQSSARGARTPFLLARARVLASITRRDRAENRVLSRKLSRVAKRGPCARRTRPLCLTEAVPRI